MQNNAALRFAPVFSDEKRVDLSLNGDQTEIKLSSWVEDLGWCTQKTISLDSTMLDELHRVITAARLKLQREKIESGDEIVPAKVLEFPKFV